MLYSNQNLKLWLEQILEREVVNNLNKLHILQIGEDPASNKYVASKQKLGQKLGVSVELEHVPRGISLQRMQAFQENILIKPENKLIWQLPVPEEFYPLIREIPWKQDVDFLGLQQAQAWELGFLPPTVQAINLVLMDILGQELDLEHKADLKGKNVAVIGQGKLVGAPLLTYLQKTGASIVSINEFTINPQGFTRECDILISGAGQPGLIDESWLKSGAIVVDAATSESPNSDSGATLAGDVDLKDHSHFTLVPSPGGIGPLTVRCLLWNTLRM